MRGIEKQTFNAETILSDPPNMEEGYRTLLLKIAEFKEKVLYDQLSSMLSFPDQEALRDYMRANPARFKLTVQGRHELFEFDGCLIAEFEISPVSRTLDGYEGEEGEEVMQQQVRSTTFPFHEPRTLEHTP